MTELTVSVNEHLAAQVAESAARHGLPIDEYVASVLAAAQASDEPDRTERSTMLARAAYRRWNADGRPETDAMTMDQVFGR
ncbi:hypothetical protein ACFWPU_46300 [Streptomyces sp. NPDC058471]|uniref:hypothetical protein n=1 Tax=Streptomyces sp. NPDC058471 TaxID=3346516 RepID=UPI0036608419